MLDRLTASLRTLALHPPLRVTVFLALSILAAWPAVLQAGEMNVFHDAQFLSAYERHARLAVLHYGQLPLWDPFSCGGMFGLGAPQTRYASPFALLSWLFGVDTGAAIIAALLPALAMEGMFRYARRWGATPSAAFSAAPLFGLSGWFGFSWHYGWVHFFSFCLVPWVLVGVHGALRGQRRAQLACAVWVAIAVGFGGTYTLPMLVLPGLAEALSALLGRRGRTTVAARAKQVTEGVAATALLVAGVGAYRLWPLLESTGATLRTIGGLPTHDFDWVVRALFVPAEHASHDPDGYFFLAPWVILLSLLAVLRLRRLALAALVGLCVWLSLGHVSPYAPFSLLRSLPIYEALRAPGRYLLIADLLLCLLAALGMADAVARTRLRFGPAAARAAQLTAALLLISAWGAGAVVARGQFASVQTEPVPRPQPSEFRQSRGNRWLMSHFAAEGMGSLSCGEAYPVPMSQRLRGDLPAEEYLVDARGTPLERGSVKRVRWSPNALSLQVETAAPARLAINQNYHPGWRSSVGDVESFEGLLSVRLPAGDHHVELRFRPRAGLGGMLVSAVSLLCGLLYVYGFARRRGLQAALLLGGPLCFVALLALWPEPAFTRPLPRDASHAPVYVQAPPADAREVGARFDVPLELAAARLPHTPLPASSREVELALYLRRTGRLGPAHSLFVHLVGPRGRRVGADHAALSGVVYLPRMPEGQLVRDRFLVPLPRDAAGRWEVQVGLYDAFGDGKRRRVREVSEGVKVQGDAITVGTFEVESGGSAPPNMRRSPPLPKERPHE